MSLPTREGKQTGIDISKWQFDSRYTPMVDYQRAKDDGVKFAIVRAGVGEHYEDEKFREAIEGFQNVDVPVAAYHVFVPHANVGVDDQIAHLKGILAGLGVTVVRGDFELPWKGVVEVTDLRNRVYEYLMRARDLVGTPPMVTAGREENQGIYTANWWWAGPLNDRVLPKNEPNGLDDPLIRACGHSLWMADYGANTGDVPARMAILPAGWRPGDDGTGQFKGNWSIWQFTSRGSVDGFRGNVDLNLMRNDVFEDLWGAEPDPDPDPGPPPNGDLKERVIELEATALAHDNILAKQHEAFHDE